MARQVLTYPDIPPVLTQAAADTRYSLVAHNHDAVYSPLAHLHTGVYLPVSHEPGTDPHPQYLNQTRGDARYLQTTTAASTYSPLGHLHTATYVDTVGDTMTGPLILNPGASEWPLALNYASATAQYKALLGIQRNGSSTWHLGLYNDDSLAVYSGDLNYVPFRIHPTTRTVTFEPASGQRAIIAGGNLMVAMTTSASTNNWAWNTAAIRAIQVGNHGALYDGGSYTQLVNNVYEDTGGNKQMFAGIGAGKLYLNNGNFYWSSAGDQGGSGVASPQTVKMTLNSVGTLTITPSTPATNNALILRGRMHTGDTGINGNVTYQGQDGIVRYFTGHHPTLNDAWFYIWDNGNAAARLGFHPAAWDNFTRGVFRPDVDNTFSCGDGTRRWNWVFAVSGSINTCVYDVKEDFAPLDPAACANAVLETDWVNFSYKPSPHLAPETPDELGPEHRQRQIDSHAAFYAKTLVETAPYRKQKGYVLQSPVHKTHDLFGLPDRVSASPGSDLAVVACALQHCLLEIAELKARLA